GGSSSSWARRSAAWRSMPGLGSWPWLNQGRSWSHGPSSISSPARGSRLSRAAAIACGGCRENGLSLQLRSADLGNVHGSAESANTVRPPTAHTHTFWADGTFSSYNENGQQVDDGTYVIVDDHTLRIGDW